MRKPRKPEWFVEEAECREDFTILVTFAYGEKRLFDFKPLLNNLKGNEVALKDIDFFMKGYVELGSIAWSDDIGIDPEELYYDGTPILDNGHLDCWERVIDELIEVRQKRNLSQKLLAEALGVAPSHIARFESKSSIPQLNTLLKVANALGCTLEVKLLDKPEKKEER